MRDWFVDNLGWAPHVVICHPRRSYLDCNRNIYQFNTIGENICSENLLMTRCWMEYNTYLQQASEVVRADFGRGLFVDLHGHSHDFINYVNPLNDETITGTWVELGHGISAFRNAVNDMRRVFDEEVTEIRTSADDPSIIDLHTRPLYLESLAKYPGVTTLKSFLMGPKSLGDFMESYGITTCPSPTFPYPSNGPFFDGFGSYLANISHYSAGLANGISFRPPAWYQNTLLDAMMIEVNFGNRSALERRLEVAEGMARSLWEWWTYHKAA
jgi:hypothetical protein